MALHPQSILKFVHLIEQLKTNPRKGWINEDLPNPESIADHMYRMSIITMLCTDTTLDKSKMVKIALVHDMAEAIVGDITPMDKVPKALKAKMELEAMESICNDLLPDDQVEAKKEIMDLFLEYEHKKSPEACFVKDVDKYELVLQTIEYEKRHGGVKRLDDFVKVDIQHPLVKSWVEDAMNERDLFWSQIGTLTQ